MDRRWTLLAMASRRSADFPVTPLSDTRAVASLEPNSLVQYSKDLAKANRLLPLQTGKPFETVQALIQQIAGCRMLCRLSESIPRFMFLNWTFHMLHRNIPFSKSSRSRIHFTSESGAVTETATKY